MAFWKNGGSTKGPTVAPAGVTHYPGANPLVAPGGTTKASPPIPQGPIVGPTGLAQRVGASMATVMAPRPTPSPGMTSGWGHSVTTSMYVDPMGALEAKEDSLKLEELKEAAEALKGWAKLRKADALGPYWCPGVEAEVDKYGQARLNLIVGAAQVHSLTGSLTGGSARSGKAAAHRALADALEGLDGGARVWIVYEKP